MIVWSILQKIKITSITIYLLKPQSNLFMLCYSRCHRNCTYKVLGLSSVRKCLWQTESIDFYHSMHCAELPGIMNSRHLHGIFKSRIHYRGLQLQRKNAILPKSSKICLLLAFPSARYKDTVSFRRIKIALLTPYSLFDSANGKLCPFSPRNFPNYDIFSLGRATLVLRDISLLLENFV